jgi:hypothetical protein
LALGGDAGVEQAAGLFDGQAGARILDAQADPFFAFLPGGEPDPAWLVGAGDDRIEGVVDQAAQHHFHLQAVDVQLGVGHRGHPQAHAGLLGAGQAGNDDGFDEIVEEHRFELRLAGAEIVLETPQHVVGPAGFTLYAAQRGL